MKNGFKVFGIIVLSTIIGFSMTACGDGPGSSGVTVKSTSGSLTISGIPSKYNGKWIFGEGANDVIYFFAAQNFNGTLLTGAQISNGSATLKVWKVENLNETSMSFNNYSGSDQKMYFEFEIVDKQTLSENDNYHNLIIAEGHATVNFTSGVGTGTFTEH